MYRRFLHVPLLDAVSDSPLVLVLGARQTGKTTLTKMVAAVDRPALYVTLDEVQRAQSAF